jgi:hypothetical protein
MLQEETPKKFSAFPNKCLHNSIFDHIFEFIYLINVHLPTFTSAEASLNEELISLDVARRDAKKVQRVPQYMLAQFYIF